MAEGLRPATDAKRADLGIAFMLDSSESIRMTSDPSADRGNSRWGGADHQQVDVSSYTAGRLAIAAFDPGARVPVWHRWTRETILESDRRSVQVVNEVVAAMLAEYPTP
ncbi:MAG: DUF4136 domain-containing protein [Pseudomonadales bacterium]|nr:DUF4136 domain-containing protein [Pseudomonadales bacterium]